MLGLNLLLTVSCNAITVFDSSSNLQHVFNAIHSSMRQWGSSLNHNGMSFFLATVPQDVLLHHGGSLNYRLHGMEWLAFEPEHALNFAWARCEDEESISIDKAQLSPKWWLDWEHHLMSEDNEGTQAILMQGGKPPRSPLQPCLKPGWLHTYITSRDLHLLYLDGQSAAKSKMGTLDAQDYILARNFSLDGPGYGDWSRAQALCKIAATDYDHRIDGYLRMEHGFEIILCDFADVDLVNILRADKTREEHKFMPAWSEFFEFFETVTSRYDGIGARRATLNYDNFVSAYTYIDTELIPDSSDLPRLNNVSNATADRIFDDVKSLVLTNDFPSPTHPTTDWQAIVDAYIARSSKRLQRLISSDITNSTRLSFEIELILRPYLNGTYLADPTTITRCANAYIPTSLTSIPLSNRTLAHYATLAVSTAICSVLHTAMQTTTLTTQRRMLTELMSMLDWTTWKGCHPSCEVNEICFTAIWPFGSQIDHDTPNCKNAQEIGESRGYWKMGR